MPLFTHFLGQESISIIFFLGHLGSRLHLHVCVRVSVCVINVRIKQTHRRGTNSGLHDKNSQMILSQATSGELKITPKQIHTPDHHRKAPLTQTTFHCCTS